MDTLERVRRPPSPSTMAGTTITNWPFPSSANWAFQRRFSSLRPRLAATEPFWQQRLGELFRAAIAGPEGEAANALRKVVDVRDAQTLTAELYEDAVARWKRRNRPMARTYGSG